MTDNNSYSGTAGEGWLFINLPEAECKMFVVILIIEATMCDLVSTLNQVYHCKRDIGQKIRKSTETLQGNRCIGKYYCIHTIHHTNQMSQIQKLYFIKIF